MADPFYVIECTAEGYPAEFYLNDVPIKRRGGDGDGPFYGAPVNQWIVPGRNELTMLIGPGETPGASVDPERTRAEIPPEAELSVRLCRYPRGAVVGGPDAEELARVQLDHRPSGRYHLPATRSVIVEIDSPFGEWVWQRADEIELDDLVVKEIGLFLEEMRNALEARVYDHFVELNQYRFEEVERSFYLPPGERAAGVYTLFPQVMEEDPDFAMEALDSSRYDLRLCARRRLVQLVAKDWKPILRQVTNDRGTLYFDMFLGKLDDQWWVLR